MARYSELIPPIFKSGAEATAAAIKKIDNVLIAAHVNPDGDAIGAMAACSLILRQMDKTGCVYIPGGVPDYLNFLEWGCPITRDLAELPFKPEAAIYVDCCEQGRLGEELSGVWNHWPSINIDHHLCGPGVGSLASFIDPKAAAACQLVAYTACALELELSGPLAEAICLGVITDTGNFTHGNTTAAIFELCAQLEQNGCRITQIGEKVRSNWSLSRLKLWGALYLQTHQALSNRVAWCVIYNEELRCRNCKNDALDGFIDSLRRMRDVEIALTVRQEYTPDGREVSRFSLRSSGSVDVQAVASALAGGGHKNAAGGTLQAPPWAALSLILSEIEKYYSKECASSL